MGYFWVNQAQEYLQSLGFKPGGELDPILARPYDLRINQYGVDNSYMTDKPVTTSAWARVASTTPRTPR